MPTQVPPPDILDALAKHDRGKPMMVGIIVLTVMGSITVCLRLYAQKLAKGSFWYDDYAIIIGWLLAVGCSISACIEFGHGGGRHLLTILTTSQDPFNDVLIFMKAGYFLTIFWGQALFWIKLSLLLFYHRIFVVGRTKSRLTIRIVMGYLVCVAVISLFDEIFQCLPVSYFWLVAYLFVGKPSPVQGSCPNLVARGVTMAVLNLVSDILLLAIPMVCLWGLKLRTSRKIAVAGILTLGTLCCVVTIVRIPYLLSSELSTDPQWDNALPILFTVLEPNGGVLCACLPCLPPLFKTKRNKKSYVTPPTQRCQDTHRWTGRTKTSIGDLEDSSTTGIKPSSYIHLGDWDSSTAPMDLSITSER